MTLVLDTKYTQAELEKIGIEFALSISAGTLTQARYDEIINIAASHQTMPEALLGLIMDGRSEWQEKHLKRFSYRVEK